MRWLLVVLLTGCAGKVVSVADSNPCGMPEFRGLECTYETLNDGSGPSDVRLVCPVGDDTWIQYADGEVFHLSGGATVCHALPDGRLCDAVICP